MTDIRNLVIGEYWKGKVRSKVLLDKVSKERGEDYIREKIKDKVSKRYYAYIYWFSYVNKKFAYLRVYEDAGLTKPLAKLYFSEEMLKKICRYLKKKLPATQGIWILLDGKWNIITEKSTAAHIHERGHRFEGEKFLFVVLLFLFGEDVYNKVRHGIIIFPKGLVYFDINRGKSHSFKMTANVIRHLCKR